MIDVIMPALSPTMETGNLVAWLKREGDAVAVGDPLAEIETDKASIAIEAAAAGTLAQIMVPEGARDVRVNAVIARIAGSGVTGAAPASARAQPERTEPARAEPATLHRRAERDETGRVVASPIARRLAREADIDIARIAGSGPNGRIVERDVTARLRQSHAPGARALDLSLECEVTALETVRTQLNGSPATTEGAEHPKLAVTDFAVKALALALARRRAPADVGLAVCVDGQLVVPVLRAAETKSLLALARERTDLAARAQARQLRTEECGGAQASVANLGMFGITSFSAAIFPGQSMSLALGAVEQRVVVRDGSPAVAAMMTVTLSADRNALDAVSAAHILREFQSSIEKPVSLLLAGS